MSDQFDEQAEQLLPCLKNLVITCRTDYLCATCKRRPAIAAALREAVEEQKQLGQLSYDVQCKELADLRAELDKAHRYNTDSMYERDGLKAEVERLKNR